MTNDELMARGNRAQQIMEDPMVVEAFATMEREIIDQWEACPVRDVEGRETIWRYYKTLKKFRGIFSGAMETGRLAAFRQQDSLMDKIARKFG